MRLTFRLYLHRLVLQVQVHGRRCFSPSARGKKHVRASLPRSPIPPSRCTMIPSRGAPLPLRKGWRIRSFGWVPLTSEARLIRPSFFARSVLSVVLLRRATARRLICDTNAVPGPRGPSPCASHNEPPSFAPGQPLSVTDTDGCKRPGVGTGADYQRTVPLPGPGGKPFRFSLNRILVKTYIICIVFVVIIIAIDIKWIRVKIGFMNGCIIKLITDRFT